MSLIMNESRKVEAIKVIPNDLSLMPDRFCKDGKAWPMATGRVWDNLFDKEHPELPPYFFLESILIV
jgi:hypothetical protein